MFYLFMSTLVTLLLAGLGVMFAANAPITPRKRLKYKLIVTNTTLVLIGIQALIYMLSVGLPIMFGLGLLVFVIAIALTIRSRYGE